MRVHLTPIVYQPVPAPRPVQRIAPAPAQPTVKRVEERAADPGRGQGRPRQDRRGRWSEIDGGGKPPLDPSTSLRSTLALLDLDMALGAADPAKEPVGPSR